MFRPPETATCTLFVQISSYFVLRHPDRLDGVELGRVRRQRRHCDLAVLLLQPVAQPSRRSGGQAVNQVINARMCKRQQMRWSLRGAHLLAQVRCAVINGDHDSHRAHGSPDRVDPTVLSTPPRQSHIYPHGQQRRSVTSHRAWKTFRCSPLRLHVRGYTFYLSGLGDPGRRHSLGEFHRGFSLSGG